MRKRLDRRESFGYCLMKYKSKTMVVRQILPGQKTIRVPVLRITCRVYYPTSTKKMRNPMQKNNAVRLAMLRK